VRAEGRLVAGLSRILPLARIHSRQMQGVLRGLVRVLVKDGPNRPRALFTEP
jgi:hypothetical protein